jgi:two-component system sensor histidine kinase DesK
MASTFVTLLRGVPFDEGADPNAAPCADKDCANPASAYTWRRAMQNSFWMYFIGLLFMPFAIGDLPGLGADRLPLAIGILVAISLCYMGSTVVADASLAARLGYILVELGLIVSASSYAGWGFAGFGVYLSLMIAGLLPWKFSRWGLLVWNVFLVLVAVLTATAGLLAVPLIGLVIGYSIALGTESGRLRRRLGRALDQAEHRVSTLAVAAERERIGRDLHDILGHSLTAISVKSGLAARLVERDPVAAGAQIAEVERIAREALTDVRATASGLQEVRLAGEIASARSVLMAAGIEAQTPSALPQLTDEHSQLFGYAVREAVTNVVRHSEATTCTIVADESQLTITDDGIGQIASGKRPTAGGNGLTGLRRRVADAGGRLSVEPGNHSGTVVRVQLGCAESQSAVQPDHADRIRTRSVQPPVVIGSARSDPATPGPTTAAGPGFATGSEQRAGVQIGGGPS